jgi:hypothetical protein
VRRGAWALVFATAAGLGLGCGEITDPYPRALPPNLQITHIPAYGAHVPPADADSVVLQFDRPMERESMLSVQRLSFLFPLAVRSFDGRWEADDTRVTFELSEFPVQPGATYEARFVGLRSAAGELYNGGPVNLRFRTKGMPDLFPMRPHPRVATRILCVREEGSGDCLAATMRLDARGLDSLRVRSACEDCDRGRFDWYRYVAGHVVWLGWDEVDGNDAVLQRVRWPQPPPLLARLTTRGNVLDGVAQSAPDGTRLERWRTLHFGTDSPVVNVQVSGRVVEVVFTGCATLDLDYALRDIGGVRERRLERWWLYPGVGVVRRDLRIERDDGTPPRHVIETLVPSVINFVQ